MPACVQTPQQQQLQREMAGLLKKVDSDLQELARCVHQPSAAAERRVQATQSRLQAHRETIRKYVARGGLPPALQSQLAAGRVRIESELRKSREARIAEHNVEREHEREVKPFEQEADSIVHEARHHTLSGHSSSSEHDVEEGLDNLEVKVLAEQLLKDGDDDASEFICQICQICVVGREPKLTQCSHLFCGDCISKWLSVQKGSQTWAGRAQLAGSVPCPVCKEPIRQDHDLHVVSAEGQGGSAVLWQILAATRIVCGNHPKCCPKGRCNWTGTYGNYQQHIRVCMNLPMDDDTKPEPAVLELVAHDEALLQESPADEEAVGQNTAAATEEEEDNEVAVANIVGEETPAAAAAVAESHVDSVEQQQPPEQQQQAAAATAAGAPASAIVAEEGEKDSLKEAPVQTQVPEESKDGGVEPSLTSLIQEMLELNMNKEDGELGSTAEKPSRVHPAEKPSQEEAAPQRSIDTKPDNTVKEKEGKAKKQEKQQKVKAKAAAKAALTQPRQQLQPPSLPPSPTSARPACATAPLQSAAQQAAAQAHVQQWAAQAQAQHQWQHQMMHWQAAAQWQQQVAAAQLQQQQVAAWQRAHAAQTLSQSQWSARV